MTLGDVIYEYRTTHKLSMDKFSELSGISKGYISMLEKNKTGRGDAPSPSFDMYKAVAKTLGMQVEDLIRKVEDSISLLPTTPNIIPVPGMHRIPILGRISAGLPIYAEEHIEGYTYTTLNGGSEYFALKVSGDSMTAARINDGDTLIVRCQDVVENGQIAVVIVGDDEATVKRFYQNENHITLMPQSTNPVHQPQIYDTKITPVRVIGRVVKSEITF